MRNMTRLVAESVFFAAVVTSVRSGILLWQLGAAPGRTDVALTGFASASAFCVANLAGMGAGSLSGNTAISSATRAVSFLTTFFGVYLVAG